ncbi:MAG: hypothetical protein ACK56I_06470, partial [bacterium]
RETERECVRVRDIQTVILKRYLQESMRPRESARTQSERARERGGRKTRCAQVYTYTVLCVAREVVRNVREYELGHNVTNLVKTASARPRWSPQSSRSA